MRRSLLLPLGLLPVLAVAQNIVRDPGFEAATGNPGLTTNVPAGSSLDGGNWFADVNPTGSFIVVSVDRRPEFAIEGSTSAVVSAATLYQDLATTAGQTYAISFDAFGYSTRGDAVTAVFGATRVGIGVDRFAATNPPTPLTHFSFLATTTSPTTRLSFSLLVPYRISLDNVSVTPVPEPSSLLLGLPALALPRRCRRA